MNSKPTVFIITHHNAGSQWISAVLHDCAPDRFVSPPRRPDFSSTAFEAGRIYTELLITKPEFDTITVAPGRPWLPGVVFMLRKPSVFLNHWVLFRRKQFPTAKIVVIRDPRDCLVSLCFSYKYGPASKWDTPWQSILANVHKEQGLLRMMHLLNYTRDIQQTWLMDPQAILIHFEALLADPHTVFRNIMNHSGISVERHHLKQIIKRHDFEMVTGRKPGQEDLTAQLRKGIAGDWRNHFTTPIKDAFKQQFGNILIETGYENDLDW